MALQIYSGLPTNKVVGMAGILDSSRFKYFLSQELKFPVKKIQTLVKKYVIGREYDGVFLKPKFGDASGVRGAARLGRKTTY